MSELPSKLFFRIGEVAGLVGVEPHVLRYWEREFRTIRPTKSAKGQRVYSRKDVENLLRVRDLLYRDGFTIAGAKKKLQRSGTADGSLPSGAAAAGPELAFTPSARRATAPDAASDARAFERDLHDADGAERAPLAAAAVEAAPSSVSAPAPVRDKLVALRSEVEAFIVELSPTDARRGNPDA